MTNASDIVKALRKQAPYTTHPRIDKLLMQAADLIEAQQQVVERAREYLNLGGIKLAQKLDIVLSALDGGDHD